MGYNTAAIILNDGLDQIAKDTTVGARIHDAVRDCRHGKRQDIAAGNHCNPMTVLSSCHADETQVILIHGNSIRRVTRLSTPIPYRDESNELYPEESRQVLEHLFKRLALQLGYRTKKL